MNEGDEVLIAAAVAKFKRRGGAPWLVGGVAIAVPDGGASSLVARRVVAGVWLWRRLASPQRRRLVVVVEQRACAAMGRRGCPVAVVWPVRGLRSDSTASSDRSPPPHAWPSPYHHQARAPPRHGPPL